MTLFFDINKLEELASCSEHFMALLVHHYNKKTIPSKWDKYPPAKRTIHGSSFLLNPLPLFEDKGTDILFKLQYIKLAAKRDWLMYKMYKYKALNTSFFPDLNYDAIKHNNLLKITPTEVQFKYEERI